MGAACPLGPTDSPLCILSVLLHGFPTSPYPAEGRGVQHMKARCQMQLRCGRNACALAELTKLGSGGGVLAIVQNRNLSALIARCCTVT